MTAHGWTCFHCGEYFAPTVDGRAEARLHFGPTPDWNPECVDRRTTAHADAVRRMRQAEFEARSALENTIGIEEHLNIARGQIADAVRRMGVVDLDAAVDELTTLRPRLKDAEAFSLSVYRQRPNCWTVAMVEVCGPGLYYPPRDPVKAP